jgi:hypothetical protein
MKGSLEEETKPSKGYGFPLVEERCIKKTWYAVLSQLVKYAVT